jgi:5-formyltetrahydrofolate cyclo-ligase
MTSLIDIRRHYRKLRRSLSWREQKKAACALSRKLKQHKKISLAQKIGIYLPQDGEISPIAFTKNATHKDYFAPCIVPNFKYSKSKRQGQSMIFRALSPKTQLNRFKIPEPTGKKIAIWTLDVLLIPLVSFDAHNHRIGRGGGFYDQCLNQLKFRPRQPLCIGLAHQCQKHTKPLPQNSWDKTLNQVITD